MLIEIAGTGLPIRGVAAEKKAIDIGSFYADSSRFAAACGWRPAISLREGLARTLTFYREHMAHYVSPEAGS